MRFYEFGRDNKKVIVLIHPSAVTWDYFLNLIPFLEKDFHLMIPALPGYDLTNRSDFISVEQTAYEIETELIKKGITKIEAVYGCSMGGSIALRIAVNKKLQVKHFILDGGITPYQLPYLLTRFIALRDFCMISLGKLGGTKIIAKAFSSAQYSKEDLRYIAKVLKHCSYKTLWNTFDSCNNYKMPKKTLYFEGKIHYWYGEKERKARDWDLKYMRKFISDTAFKKWKNIEHGDLVFFHPELFAKAIRHIIVS